MKTVEIKDQFYINGEPFKIISGAIHYFRVVPEYWKDRLEKLKAMGCNTVETYISWNMHEPEKGKFCFDGILDIKRFVREAQELGLYVILRPSPYICGEWEFGGLPAWLLKDDSMRVRTNLKCFMEHVEQYYKRLMQEIGPLQITHGGPVILMQVENEYGYYGSDSDYLEHLKQLYVDLGVTVPLVTSDGPEPAHLECGSIDGVLATANFGSKTVEKYGIVKKHIGDKPFFCMEFWVGWFDHWGNGGHMKGNLEESVKDLDEILKCGNVNIYMFHGGTNFGFMNGSNYYDELFPDVTSYDYDAVLTEDGQITEKYRRFQKVISKYVDIPEVEFSTPIKRLEYGKLNVVEKTGLFESLEELSTPIESVFPLCMEKCGQNYGYIMYESNLERQNTVQTVQLLGANDRANIFLDEEPATVLYDKELLAETTLETGQSYDKISILAENMGRVNFSYKMNYQRKGIDQGVLINGKLKSNWKNFPLPLDNIERLTYTKVYKNGTPGFYKFIFDVEEIGDTFLDFEGWGKGCAFVNGFNIGRFWEIGPQKRLYIPGPLLKKGKNTIVLFETEGKVRDSITLKATPDLG